MPKSKNKKDKSHKAKVDDKNEDHNDVIMEKRFEAAETRPQFRQVGAGGRRGGKGGNKVVLDDRFQSILTDPRFQVVQGAGAGGSGSGGRTRQDKYGRRQKASQVQKEELSAFYTIDDDKSQSNNVEGEENSTKKKTTVHKKDEKDSEKETASESEDEPEDPASRIAYLTALSRGDLDVSSSESSDEDNEDDDENASGSDEERDDDRSVSSENNVYGSAGVLDPSTHHLEEEEIEIVYEDSPYLVATNLDWGHLRAVDIFVILSSFSPPGAVKRVQVYQSDFGKARMAQDALTGPTELWKRTKKEAVSEENDSDDEDGGSHGKDAGSEDDSSEVNSRGSEQTREYDESDFDPEKLRAYEASKLKYYFAVVQFNSSENANIAYHEVDGMEFEHSSSAIDLRTMPAESYDEVTKDRSLRDEAMAVPSNYEPPEFVVSALQQTKVQCTWDQGDVEREQKLTKYMSGGWQNMSEADELQAYLASDVSSDDNSEDEKQAKGSQMRKLLGLDSDEDDSDSDNDDSASSKVNSDSEDDDASSKSDVGGKTMKFIPGAKSLEEKIRTKLDSKGVEEGDTELTPWQKYQEKRKLKRKERRQAAKTRGKETQAIVGKTNGRQAFSSGNSDSGEGEGDDFFLGEKLKARNKREDDRDDYVDGRQRKSTNAELELLLAGENGEEVAKDFDMRGIQRLEKNKGKKLKGARKKKEDKLTAGVSGKDFNVDLQDSRFAAVLEGSDDRFGIDKTDSSFKNTPAMQKILSQQTMQRKKKRKKQHIAPNVDVGKNTESAGANALSMLVKKLKTQVS